MSRTYKGSKGPGYEYWKSRYSPGAIEDPGHFMKKLTHKRERQQSKKIIKNEIDDFNHFELYQEFEDW